mmetsp:Transcript_11424/g.22407  ORF Transcript_11424/g.22407 Transcript_11424/m.22407 type:complete len:154 (+) Transcript_11424:2158-2619(+)
MGVEDLAPVKHLIKNCLFLKQDDNSHSLLVGAFERYDFDVNDSLTHDGKTCLMIAAMTGNLGIANYIIRKGAAMNLVDAAGKPALYYALASLRTTVVPMLELLYESGADFSALDPEEVWELVKQYAKVDEDCYEDLVDRVKQLAHMSPSNEII